MMLRATIVSPPSSAIVRACVDAADVARHHDLRAEPPRLLQRAPRELIARHARREA
jgi:hypothetical protein